MTKKTTQPYFHSLILIGLTSVGLMLVGSWAYATVANRVWFWLPMLLGLMAQGFFFYGLLHFYQQAQSQLNNLEGKVAQRTADLVTVNRERDAFLAVLTHDMKSPLTTIGLYGNMIKEHPRIILDRPHLPEILLRSQAQLLNIVENIQDLESWRAGPEVRLRHEAFDLAALLLALVENLRLQARLQNIDLSYAGAPLLPVSADRVMMERVFTNLISNAVKYTPAGGTIYVRAHQTGRTALIEVEDTGLGIPAADLPHIFDRFHRVADHKDKAAGTGLGLAVARALVEAHQGQIAVVSEVGVGSCFTVSLPCALTGEAPVSPQLEPAEFVATP